MGHDTRWVRVRRRCTSYGIAGLVALSAGAAAAAEPDVCREHYAGKALRWIVASKPGGGYDTYSRLIAPHLAEELGARVTIDNIPGANGKVGLRVLQASGSDGLTLGLINGPTLQVMSFFDDDPAPSESLTVLGRVAYSRHLWMTGPKSEIRSVADLYRVAKRRPIVFGVYEVKSAPFLRFAVLSEFLGIDIEVVSGYAGSRALGMSAIRGEIDIMSGSYAANVDRLESGDLHAVLQFADAPIAGRGLEGVPLTGGRDGLVATRVAERGGDVAQALADIASVRAIELPGRVVAASADLEERLIPCLREALQRTFARPGFRADAEKAKRPLITGTAEEVSSYMKTAEKGLSKFRPLIERTLAELRQ